MTSVSRTSAIRVRGRSFMAFVLAPEPPIGEWLAELDGQLTRSPTFFSGRPVVVDLAAVAADEPGGASLLDDLQARGIRIISVEGAHGAWPGGARFFLPLNGGRTGAAMDIPHQPKPVPDETSLLVDRPVRSGQSVVFPNGDVTVVGSVASGAEVMAGGSIHVYGTLRGRAVAGITGNARARIFCRRMQAELLSIDGLYRTAEDMDPALRDRAVQAWLEGSALIMACVE